MPRWRSLASTGTQTIRSRSRSEAAAAALVLPRWLSLQAAGRLLARWPLRMISRSV